MTTATTTTTALKPTTLYKSEKREGWMAEEEPLLKNENSIWIRYKFKKNIFAC